MRTDNVPIDYVEKTEGLKTADGTPKCSFTTPWVLSDLGFFRVHLTIVGPITKEPENHFPLGDGEIKPVLQAISDIVEFLKKELRRKDPPGPGDRVR